MKKLPVCLILFFIALPLWAQKEPDAFAGSTWEENIVEDEIYPEESENPVKNKFRMKDRTVELSVAHLSYGVSNTFIAAEDIFHNPFYILWNIGDIIQDPRRIYQDPVVINANDFLNGFVFNMNTAVKPLSLNFNWKNRWGFGLDIGHVDVWGNLDIPRTVLRLREAKSKTFGTGGAVFAEVGIPVFFHVNDVKVKLRPAAYLPIIYTQPSFKYSYRESDNDDTALTGMRLEVDYNMRIYTLIDMHDMEQSLTDNTWNIPKNNLGYDLGLCVEYPWNDWLDIGVDIANIPVPYAAATLNYYSQLNGKFFLDTGAIDVDPSGKIDINEDELWDSEEMSFTAGPGRVNKTIYRPFVLLFHADYRPSESRPLSLIPSLGFSLNWLYRQPFSMEGGLSARYDFNNTIITTVGINYNDRIFRNSIDFAFNLRAMEIDLGLSTQSANFIKSIRGAGIGINFGLKFGW